MVPFKMVSRELLNEAITEFENRGGSYKPYSIVRKDALISH